jgi:ribose 5-phosphate isomerase B
MYAQVVKEGSSVENPAPILRRVTEVNFVSREEAGGVFNRRSTTFWKIYQDETLRLAATFDRMPRAWKKRFSRRQTTRRQLVSEKRRIALAADHVGFALKEKVREYLQSKGLEVEDFGPSSAEPVDYPDFAEKVATRVAAKQADYGVLVCGTGLGMMLAANKVPGIRAVPANDTLAARTAREHNDANVLTMGSRMIDEATMKKVVDTWLSTEFAGGRHQRRVQKIAALDQRSHSEKKA